jgi:DNA-binding IclR family transcriptional regulator
MTDIKTALSQALTEWDEYIETTPAPENQVQNQSKDNLFKTTNNVTRATFNTVRDNPGYIRKEVLALLDDQGYKQSSTHSILSQMIKQRLVRMEEDGKLYANFKEYVPLSSTSKGKAKHVKKAKPKAAPAPAPKPEVKAAPQPQATQDKQERRIMDIEEWLSEVPLMQARLVYMRLKFIFEGESK